MTFAAAIDDARLTVLLDVRHPFSYLAFHPTVALGQSMGVPIQWLPITAPPLNAPSTPRENDDRGVRHRRYRAEAIAREIETYAEAQGLVIRDPYRDGSAGVANLGWLWARDRHPDRLKPYLAELLRGYWAAELDPDEAEAVGKCLAAAGIDPGGFREWADGPGPGVAGDLAAELQERGLYGTPAFLVENEVFYGRQHLPMIRWILEGRRGRGPI